MGHIERSVEISRPPEVVFDTLADLDRLTDWATIVVETRDISHTPVQDGATFRQTIRIAGRTLETEWRVVELERPRHVAYEATSADGGRMTMRQTVAPAGGGSRVELQIDYDLPGGVLGDLADLVYVERRNTRDAEHSLQNLKDLLEGRPVE